MLVRIQPYALTFIKSRDIVDNNSEVLGRILNVIGDPVDEMGPVPAKKRYPIHRAAPTFRDQSVAVNPLFVGIKVINENRAHDSVYHSQNAPP